MIPELVDIGASWRVLPPGVHDATFDEVHQRFATNQRREMLYQGLVQGCQSLELAGCPAVFVDGSFVTAKPAAGDYDVCWDPTNVDARKLDPVLLEFSEQRRSQKQKFGGEFFPSSALADGTRIFLEYFRTDKETGREKGIIRIPLQ